MACNAGISFDEVYSLYKNSVMAFLVKRCASFHDAEDLTQQIFVYAYKAFDKYDPTKASLKSWIYMITVSRWKNYCRDFRLSVNLDSISELIGDDESDLERAASLDELRSSIASALGKLPEKQRKAVILRYFEERSYSDIADKLDMNENGARVNVWRATAKLKKILSR